VTGSDRAIARRASVLATVALAAAVLAGGLAGYALGRRSLMKHAGPASGSAMTMLGVTRAMLLDSLGLTPGQRILIDSLLDDAGRRADSAVERLVTDVRGFTGLARERIRSALDERQRGRFDSLLAATAPLLPRTPVPPRER
jgi:hypothetical protein